MPIEKLNLPTSTGSTDPTAVANGPSVLSSFAIVIAKLNEVIEAVNVLQTPSVSYVPLARHPRFPESVQQEKEVVFTWEDIRFLDSFNFAGGTPTQLQSIIARISALLPPSDKSVL